MEKIKPYPRKIGYFLVCLVLILIISCAREEKFVGTYRSTEKNPPEFSDVLVELKEGGEGIRWAHGEEVSFEWQVKGNEIRIHTKAGGIIVAKMRHDILEVSLPGPKIVYLKKID